MNDKFDLSDTLDDVLQVAGEIQYEYGLCQGSTRIERLARCVALNLGELRLPGISEPMIMFGKLGDAPMVRLPDDWVGLYTPTQIRALATMLVRAAERAER